MSILILALLAGLAAVSAQSQDGPVTFDVGDPQGVDSMSPLIGVTVPAYETWNLMYATLTDKSAEDFSTVPGLAESWKGSDDGLTWTYKLRDGLKWSDGKPLTSEDVVWTINTARKEEWLNHSAVVGNLTARAPDPTTVVIESSIPDPKLPTMDVYILPKHIWGPMTAAERDKYPGEDGVGSGPFVLDLFEKGQFARFKANPNYWGGKPAVDRVVLRKFNNPDAMVAALKTGELDAAWDIPGAAFLELKKDENIVTNEGYQGGFQEVAINGGDGLKDPHPALLDLKVRQAMAHAIDRDTLVDRVLAGVGKPAHTIIPSPDSAWVPELSEDQIYEFDLDKARQILDDAGYVDTDDDGVREMPDGGRPLELPLLRALRRRDRPGDRGVHHRVAGRDRHRHDGQGGRRQPAHRHHRQGRLRHVRLGLDPVRRPGHDARLHDLQAGQRRPGGPDQLLQRRQLVRRGVRPPLRAAEDRARPRQA